MSIQLSDIATDLTSKLQDKLKCNIAENELNIEVLASDLIAVCELLKAKPYEFAQLIDLAGLDYSQYDNNSHPSNSRPARFAVVYHLLSLTNNLRLRIKSYCLESQEYCKSCQEIIFALKCKECGAIAPNLPSVVSLWSSANWYEREAFDLYGIIFSGHPALTRILTEDDLQGHALRKDFSVVGKTEVYYDEAADEVKSRPVTIEDRTVIQKIGSGGCGAKHRL